MQYTITKRVSKVTKALNMYTGNSNKLKRSLEYLVCMHKYMLGKSLGKSW